VFKEMPKRLSRFSAALYVRDKQPIEDDSIFHAWLLVGVIIAVLRYGPFGEI
jgi:hypothetical protein